MRVAGAALVLAGSWTVWRQYTHTLRQETALLRELSDALTLLAGEIRWRRLPLPEGLSLLCDRKLTGAYFRRVTELIAGGNTLQSAWNSVFGAVPWDWSTLLCRMEWSGDVQQLQRGLLWTARQMDERENAARAALRQREKLCGALSASCAGLLILILM